MNRYLTAAVVLLVLLAGCGGQSTTPQPTTAAPTGTTTPTTTTTTAPDNPWQSETVTVGVQTGNYSDPSYVQAARSAVEYWNQNSEEIPHEVDLAFDAQATNPDIRISYQPRIRTCGDDFASETFFYCADTSSAQIAGGYTANATQRIAIGALGYALDVPQSDIPPASRSLQSPTNRDPWPQPGNVTVGINQTAAERNMTPLVEQAVAYWEGVNQSAKNYTVNFEVSPTASNPDLRVEFTPEVNTCFGERDETIVGCAPILNTSSREYYTNSIQIETGYNNASTLDTIKHEFGHVYGRYHGQAPMPLMNATSDVATVSKPNATEVAYPWQKTSLTVAFTGHVNDRERRQVGHALSYFEEGADGLLSETTPKFEIISNTSKADITITVSDDRNACESGGGSCGEVYGQDPDGDGTLEYYTTAEITTAGVDDDRVGWHVGYWLAYSFGATESEWPEPLDGDGNDDRDGQWWT